MDESLKDNPLLVTEGLLPYDRIEPEHIVPAMEHVIAEAEKKIEKIEKELASTWDGLMKPMEDLDHAFAYAWSPVHHFLGVKNSDPLREAHETIQPKMVELRLRISQSKPVYDGLVAIRDGDEWDRLDEPQQRAIENNIRSAKHAGVGLEGEAKERFLEISRELSKLSTDFSNHLLDARKQFELIITDVEAIDGWPTTLKQIAAQSYNEARSSDGSEAFSDADEATADGGPWRITLDYPSYMPFMQHHRSRADRERLYRGQMTLASEGELDNTEIINRILTLRREQAVLLGYGTYADLSLASKMAPDVNAVHRMFDDLGAPSKPFAEEDLARLRDLAVSSGQSEPLAHWDVGFWAERLREQEFDYTDEQLRPYFPLPRVLDGLFGLAERLFDVKIERADGEAPVWHDDVQYFTVSDASSGEPMASFYLDPYSRPSEKRGGAWMAGCLDRRVIDDQIRLPVVHLVCNGTPPVGDTPSLMGFREVETLFHEFGHGLQGMLTTVDYAEVSGLGGVEWDAVELASQFMENWCYHKETLLGMTRHVETGDALPDDLYEKIVASRNFRAGSLMLRQLEFGKTDMTLHSTFDPDGLKTVFEVHQEVSAELSVLPPLEEDRFLCGFGHIFAGGYAAGYYSYKWSEVLSADAFGAFQDVGFEDEAKVREQGRQFRDTVLALGGGRHPMDVFKDFRGREPDTQALLRQQGLVSDKCKMTKETPDH
ncbi:MAG: peptidase M3 [Gemmatimonadetes bacterium]|nr:peptidase M3 [Gemmatimonadota bacterium]